MTDHIRRAGQVAWAIFGLAVLVALLGLIAWVFRVIFPPLVLAGTIVFLFNPVVSSLQRRGVPRAGGAAISYLGFFAVIGVVGALMAPLMNDQVEQLREQGPELEAKITRWIDDRAQDSKGTPLAFTRQELEDAFSRPNLTFRQQLDRAADVGLRVFHVLLIFVLGPIIGFYLLVDLPHLREVTQSLLPERARGEVIVVARRLSQAIGGFFRGQLLVALIVGAICSVGLAIISLPFWLLIGMIAGVFNIIPLVGPWIGGIPGVVVALTTGDVRQALLVVAVMAGAQQADNHFITPYVMQRSVKLHPAVVILALLAGGTLGGFLGLLLAVPAAAVVKILVSHLWRVHVLGEPLEEAVAIQKVADTGPGSVRDVIAGEARPAEETEEGQGVEEAWEEAEEETRPQAPAR